MDITAKPEAPISFPVCSTEKIVFNGIIYCSSDSLKENSEKTLCFDCGNNSFCTWQDNRKTFCEHYL